MSLRGCRAVSRRGTLSLPLSPPIQDHRLELLADLFQIRRGEGAVERAHTVRVRARDADGAVELGLADFTEWALGAIAAMWAKGGLCRASP